ncbi:MAG: M23 family metallopeptidase [Oscillospiraceae bacterium]
MKKLNNALDMINDKYIEEAANADRLQRTSSHRIRSVAVPIVSVAAVAALCFGISRLTETDRKKGVDLIDRSNAAGENTSVSEPLPDKPEQSDDIEFPDKIPLVLMTQSAVEDIIFGSEFPEMIYADDSTAIFTEGVGGVYVYDMDAQQITLAADVYDSLELAIEGFPENFMRDGGWNGVSFFASESAKPCISVQYTQQDKNSSITEYYTLNSDDLTLERIPGFENSDFLRYNNLKGITDNSRYRPISQSAAYIGDTDEFVYIRHSPTDIDLLPAYDMQYIELIRITDDEVTQEPMETKSQYYPFNKPVSKDVVLFSLYDTDDGAVRDDCYPDSDTQSAAPQLHLNSDGTFTYENLTETDAAESGTYQTAGDLVWLEFVDMGDYVVYRADGHTLYPCAVGAFEQGSDSPLAAAANTMLYGDFYTEDKNIKAEEAELIDEITKLKIEQIMTEELSQALSEKRDVEYSLPDFVSVIDGPMFVTTYHGYDEWRGGQHNGIDIAADKGSPIYAAADGTAYIISENGLSTYGNAVMISHGRGGFTIYANTDRILVSDGESVAAGQHIADVGSTGWSTGPHLHFEIYLGKECIDPLSTIFGSMYVYSTDSVWYAVRCALKGAVLPDSPSGLSRPVSEENTAALTAGDDDLYLTFEAAQGTAINAAYDGEIIFIGEIKYENGVCVAVKQTDGFITMYHEVENCSLKVGDNISAGQNIGEIGSWLMTTLEVLCENAERVSLTADCFREGL